MGKVVGVRFQRGGKIYDFDAGHFVLSLGDRVIVETEHGQAMGEVAREPREMELEEMEPAGENGESESESPPPLKKVYRLATDADLTQLMSNVDLEKEAFTYCLERITARNMEMKLVKVESMFDRSKVIFYFTADGRLDFRELVRDLVSRFRTRIEMRQIGVRHEAKLLGGLGSCGRELCCATFLRDFEPVSVKMAKEQNLSLNPTKISGLCGRLMCCLTYEFQAYHDLKRGLPKLGKRCTLGEAVDGKVIRQNVLKRQITVLMPDGGEITGTPEELAAQQPEGPPPAQDRSKPPPQSDQGAKGRRERNWDKKGSAD
ncbi:MAG: stage 0 sporulation family protein [Desulfarculaceae bacterium]|jgi:cell fate regulator YaaT (PSP1 superfamily)